MIDPYETHPQHPPAEKVSTKSLTKSQVCDIISKEMLRIENLNVPTWGFEKSDLFEVAENIVEQIEKLCNEKND